MDYRFHNLSSRSFEHLVHALALKTIGLAVSPFGDGRDGGRDATFEGEVSLPGQSGGWNGYGVVQAKFLQRPLGTEVDGAWALEQLKNELAEYTKENSTRRRPEYYIYVTNATLSSVPEVGHKDKAAAALAEFIAEINGKGYDLWDYDKLRSLLDSEPELAGAYDAWLMSGNLLARLSDQKDFPKDFSRVLTRALALDLLDDQYAKLEQAGHAADERIPLATVFVDVPGVPVNDWHAGERLSDEIIPGIVHRLIQDGTVLTSTAILEKGRRPLSRTVIIGGPGQGKTTMGQYLCQINRASLLSDVEPTFLTPEVKQSIATIVSGAEEQGINVGMGRRFPIHVVLSHLAAYLAHAPVYEKSILHYLASKYSRRLRESFEHTHLRAWLNDAPCLLVLDGLDEVPSSSNRNEVMQAIGEFLIDATSSGMDLMLVATTRPQGYNDDFDPKHYRHLALVHLPAETAMLYARRLVANRFGLESERSSLILERLQKALAQPATGRLMQTPLQVTIMAILVERTGQPPQELWALFHSYYNTIYERELSRDTPAASLLQNYRADIAAIHENVALALQIRVEHSGGTDAKMSSSEFESIVYTRLESEGHRGSELENLAVKIIEAAAQRLVFLVGIEEAKVGFEIRSLQEFVAAEALHAGNEVDVQARLHKIADITSWRNVLLFAASRCFSRSQQLRDTIIAICHRLNDPLVGDWESARLRAGSVLALEILEEGSCRTQPRYRDHLFVIASDLAMTSDFRLAQRLMKAASDLEWTDLLPKMSEMVRSQEAVKCQGAFAVLAIAGDRGYPEAWTVLDEVLLRESVADIVIYIGRRLVLNHFLSRTFVKCFPYLTLRRQVSYFDTDESSYNVDTTGWPTWAVAAFAWLTRGYRSRGKQPNHLLLRFPIANWTSWVSSINDELLASMAELPPGADESWNLVRAAAAFALNPSPHALADIPATYDEGMYIESLPWPIETFIRGSRHASSETSAITDGIRGGEWGDLADWTAAEDRWRTYPITDSDLRKASESGLDQEIASVGVPFFCLSRLSTSGISEASTAQLMEFVLSGAQLPQMVRGTLASRVLLNLAFVRTVSDDSELPKIAELVRLCHEASVGYPIQIELFVRLLDNAPSRETRDELLSLVLDSQAVVLSIGFSSDSPTSARRLIEIAATVSNADLRLALLVTSARFHQLDSEDLGMLPETVLTDKNALAFELCRISAGVGNISTFLDKVFADSAPHKRWLFTLAGILFDTPCGSLYATTLATIVNYVESVVLHDFRDTTNGAYFISQFDAWLEHRWESRASLLNERQTIESLKLPYAVLLEGV
jgi:hypothetical protein